MNNGEDCPRCLGWTFDDEPCNSMLCQGIAEGRRLERAAVVAWLHASADFANRSGKYADESAANRIALALERGEHEKGEDK